MLIEVRPTSRPAYEPDPSRQNGTNDPRLMVVPGGRVGAREVTATA
jgi:hypothetical protein